jgi:hypothetical protein
MFNVLVDGKWICETQGTAFYPSEREQGEAHNVTGRSLAQVNSRLFELTSTLFLNQVLHLQVSSSSVQSISG